MEKSEKYPDYTFEQITPTNAKCSNTSGFTRMRNLLGKNFLLFLTLFGAIFGIILGFSLRPKHLDGDTILLISYPGELFMRILKLMMLPLLVASLVAGTASLNAKMNGKIAVRTIIYFATTSLFNAFLGVFLVLLIHPGDPNLKNSAQDNGDEQRSVNIFDSLLDLGRNIFPDNLFQAAFQQTHTVYVQYEVKKHNISFNSSDVFDDSFNETLYHTKRVLKHRPGINTLGLVLFCLIFGTVLGTIGSKGQVVIDFFRAIFDVIMKMVTGIMWLTPLGVGSVIAAKILGVAEIEQVMSQVGWFIATFTIGVVFYQFIVMQSIYYVFIRKNPFKFYANLIQATLTASATCSTAAALPVTFRCMEEKLKIDPRITRFILPIGANINMDGTALFVSIASIFIAQMNRMDLGFGGYCTVILTSTVASMSSASVPSAAVVMLLIVLSSINAPTQEVTLLFAIDWFVDRIRTTNNMLGDCYCAAVVEHLSKKELNICDSLEIDDDPMLIKSNLLALNGDIENGAAEKSKDDC